MKSIYTIIVSALISLVISEWRINDLRFPINETAIKSGIVSGVEEYKKDQVEGEGIRVRKRKVRDRLLQEYIGRLTSQLNEVVDITK